MKVSIFLLFTLFSMQSLAQNPDYDTVKTRIDGLARNFRDLSSIGINAIASGEFCESELKKVREKFKNDKIIIVDLRRESHALLNGYSISWDDSNEESSIDEILLDEKEKVASIKKDPKKYLGNLQNNSFKLESIKTEAELAKENGFEYKRFAIKDHNIPDQKQFDAMVNFIKNLDKDTKLYVHCAAGKGRTTTFLTIYDILKNGQKVALSEIFKRQEKLGGARLDKVNDEISNQKELMEKRLLMFEALYNTN